MPSQRRARFSVEVTIPMSRPVALCADSTCDLGAALCEQFHVNLLPFPVILDEQEYLDGVTIDADMIYAVYREKKILPHTAAINVGGYVDYFRPFVEQGMDVVHLSLGHGLSSTYQNACLAAEEFEGRVFVVDTGNLSTASGLSVIEAAKRIAEGKSAEQVAAETRALTGRCHGSFVLDTLEFLHKGGRCSALAMMGANLLQLKPCIEVNNTDGTMGVGKKYRGSTQKAREQYVRDRLAGREDIDYEKIFITHSGTSEENIERIRQVVLECGPFETIYITRAGCTISSHCGPECLGVLFMTKE